MKAPHHIDAAWLVAGIIVISLIIAIVMVGISKKVGKARSRQCIATGGCGMKKKENAERVNATQKGFVIVQEIDGQIRTK